MHRNTREPVCSAGSHTSMKGLPPLPLHIVSVLLVPNCTRGGKTLGSASRRGASARDPASGESCCRVCSAHGGTVLSS